MIATEDTTLLITVNKKLPDFRHCICSLWIIDPSQSLVSALRTFAYA